jgi:hypothetical protein
MSNLEGVSNPSAPDGCLKKWRPGVAIVRGFVVSTLFRSKHRKPIACAGFAVNAVIKLPFLLAYNRPPEPKRVCIYRRHPGCVRRSAAIPWPFIACPLQPPRLSS